MKWANQSCKSSKMAVTLKPHQLEMTKNDSLSKIDRLLLCHVEKWVYPKARKKQSRG
jgi:hypothetical protein